MAEDADFVEAAQEIEMGELDARGALAVMTEGERGFDVAESEIFRRKELAKQTALQGERRFGEMFGVENPGRAFAMSEMGEQVGRHCA